MPTARGANGEPRRDGLSGTTVKQEAEAGEENGRHNVAHIHTPRMAERSRPNDVRIAVPRVLTEIWPYSGVALGLRRLIEHLLGQGSLLGGSLGFVVLRPVDLAYQFPGLRLGSVVRHRGPLQGRRCGGRGHQDHHAPDKSLCSTLRGAVAEAIVPHGLPSRLPVSVS